ncbi:restriction endonuclease subunit S [uncultured Azonexus sp.]|uniref:restriction endonuclease subunit S n=1 Tax=uncultured Azonexus sp. TaxID=520307 RepID=UPI002610AEB0|nr:restriction endonuclease subunit S [uncultured Azonexus sp.]
MAAVETLITDHLDLWTAALKRKSTAGRGSSSKVEMYGIKKLRELVYELAAKGLLVAGGRDTRNDYLNLGEVSEFVMGQAPAGNECNKDGKGTVFVKTGEFGQRYPEIKEWTTKPLKFAQKGDVLICVVGATIGKLNFGIDCAIGRSVAAIRPSQKILTEYLYISLVPFTIKLRQNSRGSAQGVIGKAELSAIKIRVPPLAEQHRIVAKVDELMALCDQLEQHTDASLGAHQTLVETLLSALTSAADHAQFASAWLRIAGHFDTLFTTEESIDQLKQTILQLAVMGKLVPQDPNDEPASELLKKIAAEKAKLVKEGKAKKERLLPPVGDAEAPYRLPQGWAWIRLGQCGVCSTGKTPSTNEPKYYDGDIPFIGPGQISIDGELSAPEKFVSEAGLEESTEAKPNDIFMVCIGGSIGKAAIADKRLAFNQQINAIRPILLSSKYLYVAVSSKHFTDGVIAYATGSATPIINRSKWEELPVPICSIQEQIRIVAKVDELMALCDLLKSRLSDAQATQLHLADALVEQAIG